MSLVCFHIDSKYEVKYGSRPFSLPYSFRVTDSRRNCFATTSRYRILILSQLPYEKEREVDGVRSKNLFVSAKIFRCSANILSRERDFTYSNSIPPRKYRLDMFTDIFIRVVCIVWNNNEKKIPAPLPIDCEALDKDIVPIFPAIPRTNAKLILRLGKTKTNVIYDLFNACNRDVATVYSLIPQRRFRCVEES